MHLGGLNKLPAGLSVVPVMPDREGPVYMEVAGQALSEAVKRLNIAKGMVYVFIAMAEVPI